MTSMKFLVPVVLLILGTQTDSYASAYLRHKLHPQGYGPVVIGMTPDQASKALGVNLKPAHKLDEDTIHCHYVYANGSFGPLGFMVEDNIITRIDVREGSSVQTDSGIRIGDDTKAVLAAYSGKLAAQRHFYLGKDGSYLKIKLSRDLETLFETELGKVIAFRVGRLPSVEYVEGCS